MTDKFRSIYGMENKEINEENLLTNNEIVERLAKDKVVEKMIEKITKNSQEDSLNDLTLEVYLTLLTHKNVPTIYYKGEIKFFIARILMNNICSKTSPYYRTYLRPRRMNQEINEKIANEYFED